MRLREKNQHLTETLASEKESASQKCSEMDRQLQRTINNDKALWEGKIASLKQERDQSKKDYEKVSKKFEATKS